MAFLQRADQPIDQSALGQQHQGRDAAGRSPPQCPAAGRSACRSAFDARGQCVALAVQVARLLVALDQLQFLIEALVRASLALERSRGGQGLARRSRARRSCRRRPRGSSMASMRSCRNSARMSSSDSRARPLPGSLASRRWARWSADGGLVGVERRRHRRCRAGRSADRPRRRASARGCGQASCRDRRARSSGRRSLVALHHAQARAGRQQLRTGRRCSGVDLVEEDLGREAVHLVDRMQVCSTASAVSRTCGISASGCASRARSRLEPALASPRACASARA